ncbi:hypothetical protein GCM10027610_031090 [Dactylosporangium cerinum]
MEPFKIDVDPAELADLHRRIAGTRWVRQAGGDDWDRGVPESYLRELAEHWQRGYDWPAAQDELNRIPQYLTGIDGATVHFAHSPRRRPTPCRSSSRRAGPAPSPSSSTWSGRSTPKASTS